MSVSVGHGMWPMLRWHGGGAWSKEMQCSGSSSTLLHILSRYGSILTGLLSAWEGSFPRLRLQADPLDAW